MGGRKTSSLVVGSTDYQECRMTNADCRMKTPIPGHHSSLFILQSAFVILQFAICILRSKTKGRRRGTLRPEVQIVARRYFFLPLPKLVSTFIPMASSSCLAASAFGP